jgi:hypothetical protein
MGAEDDDPEDQSLDTGCEARLQGEHRLERGHRFFAYLGHTFGTDIYDRHSLEILPGIGHSGRSMLRSEPAKAIMSGGG